MDLADQYILIYIHTTWEPPQSVAHHKKEGKGASNRLLTIAVDPSVDPYFRELLRRSIYWFDFCMSYVIFGPKRLAHVQAASKWT